MKPIRLPAEPHDSLDWSAQIEEASQREGKIVWEFGLGLDAPYFPLEDELRFQSLSLALASFAKEVWPRFQEKTAHAILYRGSADFSRFFAWSEKQEGNWEAWKEGRGGANEAHMRRLFCADAFAAYFQMLAHKLPDELPLQLIFDRQYAGSKAENHQLLSPERFAHFLLEGEMGDAQIGVCLPQDALCSQGALDRLDRLLAALPNPCRVIPESLLAEQWEGLDILCVLSGALTVQGRRKLMGFCAAGGRVAVEGEPLGLPNEIPCSELFKK